MTALPEPKISSVESSIPDTAKLEPGAVVVLRTTTKGATVWWRLKGVGDYTGDVDSVLIPLDSSLSIEAYASIAGMESGPVSTFSWEVPRYDVAMPFISPRSGVVRYSSSVQVSIATNTPKAQIYYKLGSAGPYMYSLPFRIMKNSVITAYATRPGWNRSAMDSVNIVIDTIIPKPNLSHNGLIDSGTKVEISGPREAIIRYTLDGSDPDTGSPIYESPISIDEDSVVLKARCWVESRYSTVAMASYLLARNEPVSWNSAVTYGELSDVRDGKTYKTVTIGTQTWMAENLNYAGTGAVGLCVIDSNDSIARKAIASDSCTKYGRLYTWSEVMAGAASSTSSPSGVQGICPEGWHVPSDSEWMQLEVFVGMTTSEALKDERRGTVEGTKLKSTFGWHRGGNGTDNHGFRVLPAGFFTIGGVGNRGYGAYFWTSELVEEPNPRYRFFDAYSEQISREKYYRKQEGMSLRCTRN